MQLHRLHSSIVHFSYYNKNIYIKILIICQMFYLYIFKQVQNDFLLLSLLLLLLLLLFVIIIIIIIIIILSLLLLLLLLLFLSV